MAVAKIVEAVKSLSISGQHQLFQRLEKEDAVFQEYLEDLLDAASIRQVMEQAKPEDFVPWEQVKPKLDALHG